MTAIHDHAFDGCTGLTGSLVIPNSVATIGYGAFNSCTGLTGSLVIPNSVTSIGDGAFYHCTGLTSLTIGNSVATIGYSAFDGCTGLTGSLVIPNSVTSLTSAIFYGCKGLTSLTIGNSVATIWDYAFAGCTGLNSVNIPNSVTSIRGAAFKDVPCYISYPSNINSLTEVATASSELTIPYTACNKNLASFSQTSIYYMGTNLWNSGNFIKSTPSLHTYVKPSLYEACKDSAKYASLNLSDSIPVTFPAGKEYITLCRDFDVDLRHANDNLPAGVEPLKAYIVDNVDDDSKMVYMDEIKYIPSRLKANVEGHKGYEEYVGVVLRGTPGYTYYVQMGEDDYSKGADGQMTIAKAKALSDNTTTSNAAKAMTPSTESTTPQTCLVGAASPMEVKPEETIDDVTYKTYGLKDNEFKEYESEGVIPYNKAYLRIPISTTTSSAKSSVTLAFRNEDGTTNIGYVIISKDNDDVTYNMQGMKVDASYHGLVIRGGKKHIQ
ncbi:MAG: leucine-rich repeat domain-containing protein [Prevotella sp.]|nr:leucine-rich repeat domain-containing protein [Prevotella sp.]